MWSVAYKIIEGACDPVELVRQGPACGPSRTRSSTAARARRGFERSSGRRSGVPLAATSSEPGREPVHAESRVVLVRGEQLVIEFTPLFIPGRFRHPSDLIANTLGAVLGALLIVACRRLLVRR